jgi:hypothetical protein
MGQLALTIKESFKTLTVDKNRENGGKFSSDIQDNYIDSVELSERAIQLSLQADTETALKKKIEMVQRQEEVLAPNPLQEAFTRALSLNALA